LVLRLLSLYAVLSCYYFAFIPGRWNTRNEDGIIGTKTGYYKRTHTKKRDHRITEEKTEYKE
jgi:hypothetical protein